MPSDSPRCVITSSAIVVCAVCDSKPARSRLVLGLLLLLLRFDKLVVKMCLGDCGCGLVVLLLIFTLLVTLLLATAAVSIPRSSVLPCDAIVVEHVHVDELVAAIGSQARGAPKLQSVPEGFEAGLREAVRLFGDHWACREDGGKEQEQEQQQQPGTGSGGVLTTPATPPASTQAEVPQRRQVVRAHEEAPRRLAEHAASVVLLEQLRHAGPRLGSS